MKDFRNIALFVLLVGMVPFLTDSGVMLRPQGFFGAKA